MVLGGIKKDNYKELAKRMNDVGWDQRNNDMCRHEVTLLYCTNMNSDRDTSTLTNTTIYIFLQILHLQGRYDKMVQHSKKTGGAFYLEPLRFELTDTFGVMENIAPESVFSSRRGLEIAPNSVVDDDDEIDDDSSPDSSKSKKDKTPKCKYNTQIHLNYID